jgi:hypothetical protein
VHIAVQVRVKSLMLVTDQVHKEEARKRRLAGFLSSSCCQGALGER